MNDGCAERRIALGAYVLGALRPDESDEIESHLAGCAGCRDELSRLVDLPAVLGRLSRDEALAAAGTGPDAVPAPGLRVGPTAATRPTLLERTLAELGRRRRRQRLRWRVGLATGGAAVIALAAAVGVLVVSRPAPAAPVVAAVARLSGVDQSTGVRASAELYSEAWGTSIHLDVSGVTPGDQCELVVMGQDGSQQVAGTWKVGYTGGVEIDGAAGISPAQVSSLQIVTTSGSELLALHD
ncbi:MAG: zf-HC2 domain-containing protein [Candidatus Dormibacteria bacterium]|jgi:anti-sigma factor RsiW